MSDPTWRKSSPVKWATMSITTAEPLHCCNFWNTMERHRGDRFGDGGRYSRMPSRWPYDSQPNQHQRYARGGGIAGSGEGFSDARYHPYRGQPDYLSAGSQGLRDDHGDLGAHQMPMGGQKRGFAGRGGSPDFGDGNKFAKLFVGSVPKTATEEDIRPLFEEHGDVVEVVLIKDWRTGHQQGFGFIKYASSEHADRAIRALHNRYTLPGATGPIQVKYADGERDRFGTSEDKLFVASLNRRATEKEVEEIFALYGHVEDVYLMKDEMKQSRGCGFVKFSNRDMALAAMNALHGTYVMRGCDQPLVVRFAEPKRPRPVDQRNAPTFGGPGFGSQSDAVILNSRQPENFDEPRGGHISHKAWLPLSPQSGGLPSQSSTQGFGSLTAAMVGITPTLTTGSGSFGDAVPPANGALPNLAPISSSQSFNPPIAQTPPAIGQQNLSLQKTLPLLQNLPPALPLHNALLSFSHVQTQALQAPVQQLGQFQLPQSVGFNTFTQAQKVSGLSAQLSASPSLTPQNAIATTLNNPNQQFGNQQSMPAVPNQQQLPHSNMSQQLLQQAGHQLPAQTLLQQQAQTLQSSYQSSQQAIFQIQQQLQMMQNSNMSQQQSSQSAKQQLPWSGPRATATIASLHVTAIPSTISATPSHALSAPSVAVASTCNWTEHTSPEGFKYYYNSVTRESKWEKPEELTVFEQQQQQKLLLLQQQQLLLQQQKIAAQQLKSPSHTPSQMQVQPNQQLAQTQVLPQMQARQQAQVQILQPSLAYQASSVAGHQTVQDLSNPQLRGVGSVIDSTKMPKML